MDNLNLSPEIMEKIKNVTSPEELEALAKEYKIDLPKDKIQEVFGTTAKTGELDDDDLDNVSGGLVLPIFSRLLELFGLGSNMVTGTMQENNTVAGPTQTPQIPTVKTGIGSASTNDLVYHGGTTATSDLVYHSNNKPTIKNM